MDTGRLKRFATEARNILMQGVVHRIQALGFQADGTPIEEPQLFAGGATFMGDTVSEDFYNKWLSLKMAVITHSLEEIAEEAAYTWFNRLVAIRIMVKNNLIAPILQYESEGVMVPLLVSEARQGRMPSMSADEQRKLLALLEDDSKTADQFRILIVAFCHANPVINCCFGHISDYTELLLPTNILAEGGFIDMLNNTEFITDDDYKTPELIGWLYQYYISEKKDDVFASFKKGKKAEAKDIPAATQIFTPNWIVKYMVQNTVGRIYLDNNPYEKEIQKKWKYLVEPTEPTPQENILHYNDLTELKFADLACGSGHILNEGFDILYDLYQLEGYSRREAIENIFKYNLTGVDIDTRAKQLAQYALLLKACQKDSSFADAHLMPRVLDMPEPYHHKEQLLELLPHFLIGGNQKMVQEITDAIELMDQAKNLGSIMKFNISEQTRNAIAMRMEEYDHEKSASYEFEQLKIRLRIILALTDKYAAVVMNPPYMGGSNMNTALSDYVKRKYSDGKADLMTVFMMVSEEKTQDKGKYAMINLPSWLFLSTFENIRLTIVRNYHIDSLLHMGRGIFGIDWGTVAFTISKHKSSSAGSYFKLHKRNFQHIYYYHIEKLFLKALQNHSFRYNFDEYRDDTGVSSSFEHNEDGLPLYFESIQSSFTIIPGCPIGYWVNETVVNLFKSKMKISTETYPKFGMSNGDGTLYTRNWYELSPRKIGSKWFKYDKGGPFRRWYGNRDFCVNWENDGFEIKNNQKSAVRNAEFFFKPHYSWTLVGSGKISVRYFEKDFILDTASNCVYFKREEPKYILGLLNSKVSQMILNLINPTINNSCGVVGNIPVINIGNMLDPLIDNNIAISKTDWDTHETSWDFDKNELIRMQRNCMKNGTDADFLNDEDREELLKNPEIGFNEHLVEHCLRCYKSEWTRKFNQLHSNEEELNRQFIEIYGLQDELTPDVPLDEITILQQGEISIEDNKIVWHPDVIMKQLISYAVGCMMGRYSLDKPGLILANQGDGLKQFNELVPGCKYEPDDDGIIPLMPAQSDFADNATVRFKQWLAVAFGEDTLVDNLNFIEASLGKSIDDYFVKDFWKDHKKMYQNRPIYWLFSSKKGAFQCLTYMHRMDAYTAERVRTKYLLPHIEWLLQKQNELTENLANLTSQERRQLDNITKQIQECREYHDRLHVVADHQIGFDLDDGVVVNYAKFGDVLSPLK